MLLEERQPERKISQLVRPEIQPIRIEPAETDGITSRPTSGSHVDELLDDFDRCCSLDDSHAVRLKKIAARLAQRMIDTDRVTEDRGIKKDGH